MKISVIITAFNAEDFISRAIDSFLEQDYQNKELLIIDDISTDKTHQIIASYQERFPEIVRWIKEKDYGISHARNLALKHVTGDLVGFLGAEDFLHKDFFREVAYYVKQNPKFSAMYFNSYNVGAGCVFNDLSSKTLNFENLINSSVTSSCGSFYYRREVFEIFQFNEKNRYSVDYEFNLALANNQKFIFYPINITSVFNFDHEGNLSASNKLRKSLEIVAIKMKYANNTFRRIVILWQFKRLVFMNRAIFHQISRSI